MTARTSKTPRQPASRDRTSPSLRGPAGRPRRGRWTGALAAQRRYERRTKLAWRGGLVLLAVVGVGFLVWIGASSPSGPSSNAADIAPTPNGYGAAGVPPWPAPDDTAHGVKAAGLTLSSSEGTAQHFHTHLDVVVDGRPAPVRADLGVDESGGRLAALHTHDAGGVLHVESPNPNGHYILGQLFNEWNVRLNQSGIGGLAAGGGQPLSAYVNGRKVEGNPAAVPLQDHAEIALVYGPQNAPANPPATYNFGNL